MTLSIFTIHISEKGWYFSLVQKTRKDKIKKDWAFFSIVALYDYKKLSFHWLTKA